MIREIKRDKETERYKVITMKGSGPASDEIPTRLLTRQIDSCVFCILLLTGLLVLLCCSCCSQHSVVLGLGGCRDGVLASGGVLLLHRLEVVQALAENGDELDSE